MAVWIDKPKDGGEEIACAYSKGGINGPHVVVWGLGVCLHIYEDEGLPLSLDTWLSMAHTLEKKLMEG